MACNSKMAGIEQNLGLGWGVGVDRPALGGGGVIVNIVGVPLISQS